MMLELIIAFVIGWILGWRINDALRTAAVKALLKELGVTDQDLRRAALKNGIILAEAPESAADEVVVEVRLEQDGGQIYAYRKDDSTFLGQGHDKESLIAAIAHRMKDVRLVIAQEDGADLLQKSHS